MRPARCRRSLFILTALVVCAAPCLLTAQGDAGGGLTATVDVGGSRIHYDGFLPSGALDISPSLRLDATDAVLVARGTVARFESGNLSTRGIVAAGIFMDPWGPVRGELFLAGAAGHHQTIGATGRVQLGGRLHLGAGDRGAWAGASSGWSALGGDMGLSVTDLEAGGWLRRSVGSAGSLRATAVLHMIRVQGLAYSDVEAALRWASGRVELGMDGGVRMGDRVDPGWGGDDTREGRSWLAGDAAVWFHPRAALVASVGRFLVDPTNGSGGGRFASLGLRLALRRPPRDELPRVVLPRAIETDAYRDATESAGAAEQLIVEEGADGVVTLRFRLPGAASASIMGDFTDWTPVSLARDENGLWSTVLTLPPGVHRLNLRTDDGDWRAPPGLTVVDDGFGGEVGLLVVRR